MRMVLAAKQDALDEIIGSAVAVIVGDTTNLLLRLRLPRLIFFPLSAGLSVSVGSARRSPPDGSRLHVAKIWREKNNVWLWRGEKPVQLIVDTSCTSLW